MQFPLVLSLSLIVIAHCAAASQTVLGEEPPAADIDAALIKRIENLLFELDAEEFQMRELASKKLGEIGEPARSRLMELAEKPPSPEVRIRVAALLRQFDLAALRRNAIKLDDFYTIVQQANADKLDRERLDLLLEQLVVVLRDATGNESLKLPVRLADVKLSPLADRIEDKSLLITRRGQTSFVRNSIVLADVAFEASSIDNSIIIARAGVNASSVSNSIIIAGYDVSASSCRDCILLSSGIVATSIPRTTIVGAGERAHVSIARENVVFVNTVSDARAIGGREAPREVKTEGLILRSEVPAGDNPLAEKIVVTAALGNVILFRRTARGGELVARFDKPIEHPDGGELPETAGWLACYASQRNGRSVVFTNGERFVNMPITRP